MKTFTLYFLSVALLGFGTLSCAEIIQWAPCGVKDIVNCTVHEVAVEPCRGGASGTPCVIRRGRTAGIRFDFTPDFSGNLTTRAYWESTIDLPFTGMDTDACSYTTCPAVEGTRQTYDYTLPIDRSFQPRNYDIKWKIWNEDNVQCCFRFRIHLKK